MLEVKRKPATHSHGSKTPVSTPAPEAALASGDKRQITAQKLATHPATSSKEPRSFQAKMPVITGEVHFKGVASIEGMLTGQLGSANGLSLKQKASASLASQPELQGEISFRDMVRVNGHIAGSVYSQTGTLIVDTGAHVEASVDVAVAVIGGSVTGDIVARERVELGPSSKIHGNIWTRSIVIKDGAIFEGVCRMLEEAQKAS
jgi:cytoskeletal protein CcmA (bactofilin family)